MNKFKVLLISSFTVLLLSFMLYMKSNFFTSHTGLITDKIILVLSATATLVFFILDVINSKTVEK